MIRMSILFVCLALMIPVSVTAQGVIGSPPVAAEPPPPVEKLILLDGSSIVGRVVDESEGTLTLRLLDGSERVLYAGDVVSRTLQKTAKVVKGKVWDHNPNRTRHLWAPSAMPLNTGEGYISNKYFVFLTGAYGVTDNLTLLGGSFWPGLLAGGEGFNLIAAAKYGTEVAENLHVAFGAEIITFPTEFTVVTPFAGVTWGTPDTQITFNVGKLEAWETNGNDRIGEGMFSIAAQYRFLSGHAFVLENLFFPGTTVDFDLDEDDDSEGITEVVEGSVGEGEPDSDSDSSYGYGMLSMHALCYRQIDEDSAWDYGFITIVEPGGNIVGVLPWIDYTWYLGD
jgi:hypothetical protein